MVINSHYFKINLLLSVMLFFFSECYSQLLTTHNSIPQTDIPKPTIGISFNDPNFYSKITRISDAVSASEPGIFPHYSKRQAWNTNDSLLILGTGNGYFQLYNGKTYAFIKTLYDVYGEDVFWNPTNPLEIIFTPDSSIYKYNVSTEQLTLVHTFTNYTWVNTRGEGNLSNDGNYYAFVGQKYNYGNGEVTFKDIVLYDLMNDQILDTMTLPTNLSGFDWVSISPKGNYIVIDYADDITGNFHGVEVYDTQFNLIWQKPLGAGHSDLGIDNNGDEILVMDVYDSNVDSTFFYKYRLSDGQITQLLGISSLFDQHISLRNNQRTEWCFISTFDYVGRLTDDSASWLPFEDEIFALKLDGSRDVERIAHHHSRRYSPSTSTSDNSNYYAEPHATVNHEGNKIIFGSNWRENIDQANSVDAYVVDFSSLVGINDRQIYDIKFDVFPNPVINTLYIDGYNLAEVTDIKIYNLVGENISINKIDYSNNTINFQNLNTGIYFIEIQNKQESYIFKVEKVKG